MALVFRLQQLFLLSLIFLSLTLCNLTNWLVSLFPLPLPQITSFPLLPQNPLTPLSLILLPFLLPYPTFLKKIPLLPKHEPFSSY